MRLLDKNLRAETLSADTPGGRRSTIRWRTSIVLVEQHTSELQQSLSEGTMKKKNVLVENVDVFVPKTSPTSSNSPAETHDTASSIIVILETLTETFLCVVVRSDRSPGSSDVCCCTLEVVHRVADLLLHRGVSRPPFCFEILVILTV